MVLTFCHLSDRTNRTSTNFDQEIIMRAIVRKGYGGTEELVIQKLPVPEPKSGEIVIQVKAFGLNHAETYMRKGDWGDVAKVSGIECVGLVRADSEGRFPEGQKVAALMGGMGRTINGSTLSTHACRRPTSYL